MKIFRQLRRVLIKERKYSKYLSYAFGEVVLVVIGILIALQINNWNNNVQDKKILIEYLSKIQNDIQNDIIILDSIRLKRISVNERCRIATQKIMANEYDPVIFISALEAFLDDYFTPNQNGYQALKSSIYLPKINGSRLDSLLIDYENQVNKLVKEEEGYFKYIENMEVIWTSEVNVAPLLFIFSQPIEDVETFLNSEIAKEKDLKNYLKHSFSKNSFVAVIARTSSQTAMLSFYSDIINTGEAIISEINSYKHD